MCASHRKECILREKQISELKVEKLRLINITVFRSNFRICITNCSIKLDSKDILCSRIPYFQSYKTVFFMEHLLSTNCSSFGHFEIIGY